MGLRASSDMSYMHVFIPINVFNHAALDIGKLHLASGHWYAIEMKICHINLMIYLIN